MIECNEWRTEKRHECANMGKVKRLELWWQMYRTSLPVRDLQNFRPMDFCSTECTHSNQQDGQTHLIDDSRIPYTYINFCAVILHLVRFTGLKECLFLFLSFILGGRTNHSLHSTGQGLDDRGTGIRTRQEKNLRSFPDRLWGPSSLLFNGYRGFLPGV